MHWHMYVLVSCFQLLNQFVLSSQTGTCNEGGLTGVLQSTYHQEQQPTFVWSTGIERTDRRLFDNN